MRFGVRQSCILVSREARRGAQQTAVPDLGPCYSPGNMNGLLGLRPVSLEVAQRLKKTRRKETRVCPKSAMLQRIGKLTGILLVTLALAIVAIPYYPYYPARYEFIRSLEYDPPGNLLAGSFVLLIAWWFYSPRFRRWLRRSVPADDHYIDDLSYIDFDGDP